VVVAILIGGTTCAKQWMTKPKRCKVDDNTIFVIKYK
jgi:hypothetical protein